MTITTFQQLIDAPVSKKIALAELTLGEQLSGVTWTQETSPNTDVYSIDYLYEDIPLTSGNSGRIVKTVESAKANGVLLTAQTNIADVQANPDSFWHDKTNQKFYCSASEAIPGLIETLVVYFGVYIASEGIVLNNRFYEPYLKTAPGLNQSSRNVIGGFSQVSSGQIKLNNETGFFDRIYEKFIWTNRTARVLFGGESLPYTEYQPIFTGICEKRSWSESGISVQVKSHQIQLLRTIPEDEYTLANFPDLNQNYIGSPIPIAYGTFTEYSAPIAAPIDEIMGANQVQFNIAGHAIFAIDGVWIDYGNETGWQVATLGDPGTTAHEYSKDLANANIIVRFTAGGYQAGTTRVKAAFRGKTDGVGALISSTADIVEDILVTYNDFDITLLNSAVFAQSKIESTAAVGVYIGKEERTKTIIDKICSSDLAYFYLDSTGKFAYKVWAPEMSGAIPELDETDILLNNINSNTKEVFAKIKVGYNQSCDGHYLYQSKPSVETNKHETKGQKLINTYLVNAGDADILAARAVLIHGSPITEIKLNTKWIMSKKDVGDKFQVTISRAPSVSGGYDKKIFEIASISKKFGLITFRGHDLNGLGYRAGFYTGDTAPDWANSTEQQKAQQGYWLDDQGYADPADPASKNVSTYW